MMNTNDQLELGLNNATRLSNSLLHRQRRMSRAKWWFSQMRRAVDSAIPWQPAARPEQTWFADPKLSGRIEVTALVQYQTCE